MATAAAQGILRPSVCRAFSLRKGNGSHAPSQSRSAASCNPAIASASSVLLKGSWLAETSGGTFRQAALGIVTEGRESRGIQQLRFSRRPRWTAAALPPKSNQGPAVAEEAQLAGPANGVKVLATEDGTSGSAGALGGESGSASGELSLVGEDAAAFDWTQEKTSSWVNFTLVLGVVLAILYYIWLDPETGFGGAFIDTMASVSSSREMEMVLILAVFAVVHSGGAALRASAEKLIGERAYRVLFAGLSLPLAVSAVVFFINHRYDGVQLWQLRTVPGVHEFVWAASFVSFFFLYPSTFNLLEVAAVDKPKVHMWETGIMRITRHPQMAGQLIWCIAHTMWIGNTFTLTTSLALCAHHAFGVWHGDQRLAKKYGAAFEEVKARTSIVPFAAILDGRQKLPDDYYKEFVRAPYFAIVAVTVGAYFSHPLMQQASHWLHW